MNDKFSDLVREYIFAEMRLADARRELALAQAEPASWDVTDFQADYDDRLADARLKAKALDDRAATADH